MITVYTFPFVCVRFVSRSGKTCWCSVTAASLKRITALHQFSWERGPDGRIVATYSLGGGSHV
jgi:hypothetical protein